jgi:hypothetical protein
LLGATAFWYVQVGLVVAGHVCALILAHDRAVAIYDNPKRPPGASVRRRRES